MSARQTRWHDVLGWLAAALASRDERGWLVGGAVRDALLGRPVYDVDVAVAGDPLTLANALAATGAPGASVVPLRLGRQTIRIVLRAEDQRPAPQIDLSRLRGRSIDDDVRARDFTVNALALPLGDVAAWASLLDAAEQAGQRALANVPGLLDPLGGLADLRTGALRAASPSALAADPLRVLRGVRLSARLGLTFDAATFSLARAAVPGLRLVAPARIRDELWAILRLAQAPASLTLLRELGACAVIWPEFTDQREDDPPTAGGRLEHAIRSLTALDAARAAVTGSADANSSVIPERMLDEWCAEPLAADRPRWLTLRWATLLHALPPHSVWSGSRDDVEDLSPSDAVPTPAVRTGWSATPARDGARALAMTVARRMGLSPRERAVVGTVVTHQALAERVMRAGIPDERAARRLFAFTGEAGVDVVLAALACAQARADDRLALDGAIYDQLLDAGRALLARFFTARETVIPPQLLDGRALLEEIGDLPGRAVGQLLTSVRAAQIDGSITTREEALRLARALHARR